MAVDFYCYPNSNVLRNKFDIHNDEELDIVERNRAFIKLAQRDKIEQIFEDGFNYESLKKLHKFVFEDVYDWAGKEREIEVVKHEKVLGGLSVTYSFPTEIEENEYRKGTIRRTNQVLNAHPEIKKAFVNALKEIPKPDENKDKTHNTSHKPHKPKR